MIKLLVSAALTATVVALPHWHQGKLIYDNGKPMPEGKAAVSDFHYFMEQRVDHFDRSNLQTFDQRYFINTTYWKGAETNAPVFLCVGGEGPPLDWMVLVSSVHCNDMVELAPKHGALLLALEHRFYGPSTPNDDFSTENLRFLSSEQALGDIAQFHAEMTSKFGLTSSNKWVSFGGSYPGMMAAMARLRYPHLFHASVSSSSPLQAQVEMVEYNEVVAKSMSEPYVGGSETCLNAIKDGHVTVGQMLETFSGRRELEEMFNVCVPGTLEKEENRNQFAGYGVVYLPVQSNDPSCTTDYCNIEKVCAHMVDESLGTPLERLVSLQKAQNGGACTEPSYQLVIEYYSSPSNSGRSWLYQTCNEWGYYQTCPVGSQCPYTQGLHTLDTDYDICLQAFNITSEQVNFNIAFANSMYGGDQIQATRILYPNGQIDPWSALGVLSSPNDQEPTLWVTGASHHFWTHPTLETDDDYVVAARQTIWDQVDAWLLEEN